MKLVTAGTFGHTIAKSENLSPKTKFRLVYFLNSSELSA